MLSHKEIHFLIDEGLSTFGIFENAGTWHQQLDYVINHVTVTHLTDVLDKPKQIRSNVDKDFLRYLTRETYLDIVSESEGEYNFVLPTSYLEYISSQSRLIKGDCCGEEITKGELKKGKFYQAERATKYEDKWYKKGDHFRVNNTLTFYGGVIELPSTFIANLEVPLDDYNTYKYSAFYRAARRPLLAVTADKVKITTQRHKIVDVLFTYITGLSDDVKIRYCDEVTLNLSEPMQRFIIDKTIKMLAVWGEQRQEKINNLQNEIIN